MESAHKEHSSWQFMRKKYPSGTIREALAIALPLVISNSAHMVMIFCDRMFLANYSDLAIQAAVPAGNLAFTMICLFTATAGYSTNLVAQYYGADKEHQFVHATMQGVYFILFLFPLILLTIPIGNWLIQVFGHAPELAKQEEIYLAWMILSALPVGFGWSIGGFFTGQGRVKLNTAANIIGCVFNIILDYALIFGKFGFPEMGIRGAAIATFTTGFIAPSILFYFMLRTKHVRKIGLGGAFRVDFPMMKKLVQFGMPAGLQLFLDQGAFSFFLLCAATLDEVSLSVNNIALSINGLAFSPLLGFGMAASILCGQYQGAGDSENAVKSVQATMRLGFIYMAFIGAVFLLFPATLISLFASTENSVGRSPEFLRMGRTLMYLMTAWGLFDTINIVLIGGLKGAGDTKFVMIFLSAMAWFFWIPGELLIFHYGGGIIAAWVWLMIYVDLLAIGFWWRWRTGRWKSIKMVN